jgi:ADP-ribose pyrophosphatase YjhB (NUDIX family)
MSFEPQRFFIGLSDFFTVLLPGAVLAYAARLGLAGELAVAGIPAEGTEGLMVLLFASYVLGHFVFLVGAWLDVPYDWLRRRTLDAQIARLARRGVLLRWPVRAMSRLVFGRERGLAVGLAVRLKEHALAPLDAKDTMNAYQWCKIELASRSPENLAAVQRFEADSKFFRSFAVVLPVLAVLPIPGIPAWGRVALLALLVPTLWRYMEQRHKATNQAYWSVIALAARNGVTLPPTARPHRYTHAGGVVFREFGGQVQYLLVRASDDPALLVLPKGHIEPGEHPRQTAVREVHEETGVWAEVLEELRPLEFEVRGTGVVAAMFLMEAVAYGVRADADRGHAWLTREAALGDSHRIPAQTRALLEGLPEGLPTSAARSRRAARPKPARASTIPPDAR